MIGNSEGEGGGGVEKPKESMKLEFDSFLGGWGGRVSSKKTSVGGDGFLTLIHMI